jgi:methyl-accepting chemotaxis protein
VNTGPFFFNVGFMKVLINLSLITILFAFASCGGGGGPVPVTSGGTVFNPVFGTYNSPDITAISFVKALNNLENTNSVLLLNTYETQRTTPRAQDWFVIWDDKNNQFKAVSLYYVESLVYFDFFSNNESAVAEFRKKESAHNGNDYYNYEIVDQVFQDGRLGYQGRVSGSLYEDEATTTDVNLMAKDNEKMKFIRKAANVSLVYNLSIQTSLSLVTLGSKMEKMLSHGNGELTTDDRSAIAGDLKNLTGMSLEDIQAAANDSSLKSEVLSKIASKIGTSAQSLEQNILPELFGITL